MDGDGVLMKILNFQFIVQFQCCSSQKIVELKLSIEFFYENLSTVDFYWVHIELEGSFENQKNEIEVNFS